MKINKFMNNYYTNRENNTVNKHNKNYEMINDFFTKV